MLTIRNEQMQTLAQARYDAFEQSLSALVAASQSGPCGGRSEREIRAIVQAGITASAALGLHLEQEIRRITLCMAKHGVGFTDTEAWAQAVVNDVLLSPGEKLWRLEQHQAGRGQVHAQD